MKFNFNNTAQEILTCAIEVAAGAAPPKEFRVFGPGMNVTENGTGLFDKESAAEVMDVYKAHGVDKMIDLEHLSLDSESPNFDPDARGWMKLELRGSADAPELWATDVKWTADGARRLSEKTQRYISPAFAVDKKSRRIVKLHNVAMTALPASHGIAPLIAASRSAKAPCGCQDAPAPDATKDCLAMLSAREYLRESINIRSSESGQAQTSNAQSAAYPWDQCIADQIKRGHSEDSAKRICAYIKNQNASVNATDTKANGEKMGLQGKDAELAGAWLSQVKSVAESAQDAGLKELATKVVAALGDMLGQGGAEEAAKAASEAQKAATEAAAANTAATTVAAAARKLTGKDKSEDVLATISSWKERAEKSEQKSPELETLQASIKVLSARVAEAEIKDVLAANRDKCNPAFEVWALKKDESGNFVRSVTDVTEALATREAKTVQTSEPNKPANTDTVELTAADREVCSLLGTSEEAFLKHKTEEIRAARAVRK